MRAKMKLEEGVMKRQSLEERKDVMPGHLQEHCQTPDEVEVPDRWLYSVFLNHWIALKMVTSLYCMTRHWSKHLLQNLPAKSKNSL